ncbi:MAG: EngA family GTP-binding protein, partial [Pirellulales bacterium]|nr:EngA family GTP-binding protein [Pirellulales bacterium]
MRRAWRWLLPEARAALIPQIVITGRPNVGKSSLFNWLIEKRIAIEDPTAGVTRDRLVQRIELDGRVVDLVDTGGMGFDDPDGLTAQIDAQIESGLATAAAILLVVDIRAGLAAADEEVARRVRRAGTPVILVANKADSPTFDAGAADFAPLGFGQPVVVSARQHRNRGLLEDA